jgi:hypothetical protein
MGSGASPPDCAVYGRILIGYANQALVVTGHIERTSHHRTAGHGLTEILMELDGPDGTLDIHFTYNLSGW